MKFGLGAISDWLFPIFCVGCEREGEWWCEKCLARESNLAVYACPVCFAESNTGEPCLNCRAVSPLNQLTALFIYKEKNPVGRLIKQFKYQSATSIAEVWERLAKKFALTFPAGAVFMPIPLYPRRERERGFNQANIIARIFAKRYGLPVVADGLRRQQATVQQAKISRAERMANMRAAFVWNLSTPPPAKIVLVDDVYTTGATMQECAQVLKNNGVKWVGGLALARD